MLQDVSNPSGGPFSLYYHVGKLYRHDGGNHSDGLEAFSIVTRNTPGWEGPYANKEETQAFIFDPEYIRRDIGSHAHQFKDSSASQFVVVQLERDVTETKATEYIGGMRITRTGVKNGNWKACDDKEWKHTLNSLARNEDKDLVVAAAHEKMVKDLEEVSKTFPEEVREKIKRGRAEAGERHDALALLVNGQEYAAKCRELRVPIDLKRAREDEPHSTESSDRPAESKKSKEEGEFTDHVVEHHEGV